MLHVGWAADGFPIYYSYGFESANDNSSSVKSLGSSYQMKSGDRPGDGDSAPCGPHTGVYSADYEYVEGLGDLDECNGMTFKGSYGYYVTDGYPYILNCFKGTIDSSFQK